MSKSAWLMLLSLTSITAEVLRFTLIAKLDNEHDRAASSLIFAITKFSIDPFLALTKQNATFIAQEYGKLQSFNTRDDLDTDDIDRTQIEKNIGALIRQGWKMSAYASVIPMILLFCIKPILMSLSIPDKTATTIFNYFIPIILSLPILLMNSINERFFAAVNHEKWLPLYQAVLSLFNIIFSFILIPNYGVTGLGLAITGQSLLGFILSTAFIANKSSLKAFSLFDFSHPLPSKIKTMMLQGLPLSLGQLTLAGVGLILSLYIRKLGKVPAKIEITLLQLYGVITTFAHAFNESGNRLSAQLTQIKAYQMIRFVSLFSLLGAGLCFILLAGLLNVFREPLAQIFLKQDEYMKHQSLVHGILLYGFFIKLFELMQDTFSSHLSGVQDTWLASGMTLLTSIFIILPMATVSYTKTQYGLYGIAFASAVGSGIAALVDAFYWFRHINNAIVAPSLDITQQSSNQKLANSMHRCLFFQHSYADLEDVSGSPRDDTSDTRLISMRFQHSDA